MWKILGFLIAILLNLQIVIAATYYLAPNMNLDGSGNSLGSDSNNGLSPSTPWKTFNRAVGSGSGNKLQPGDTLILMDGIYTQAFYPSGVRGQSGSPITIKAQNDGHAVIDGGGVRIPIFFEGYQNATYFVMEGIVARNSSESVIQSFCDNNTFRRVSGYNASTNGNDHVFLIMSHYNLLEDCVAAGSGRKMFVIFGASGTSGGDCTIRRCFSAWQEWKGGNFCMGIWPWGENIDNYNSSNNIIENCIAFGKAPAIGIEVFAQSGTTSNNNQVLGSMSIREGMNWDGTQEVWPCPCPYNSSCTGCTNFAGADSPRQGFRVGNNDGSTITNNTWRDIFAWGNGGLGFYAYLPSIGSLNFNNVIDHATMLNNGLGSPIYAPIRNISMTSSQRSLMASITNSVIDGVSYGGGGGARLQNRYVDGVLTSTSLWPWPMEDRIRIEFSQELGISNFSVTKSVCEQILKPNGAVGSCGTVTPPPPSRCDVNTDDMTNVLDLQLLANAVLLPSTDLTFDINKDGAVNGLDIQVLINVIQGVTPCP